MTTPTLTTAHRSALRRMTMRDPSEPHRAASSLELLFDLVFVVGVSFASQSLHHSMQQGHVAAAVLAYVMAFFGLWWAWMNFTWFATSFDTDDWLYRLATGVQMGGALTYAAGLPALTNIDHPSYVLGVTGYIIMRLPMAFQWFRAAYSYPATRRTTLRYGFGIIVVQCYWVLLLVAPADLKVPTFFFGIVLELLVPVSAESAGRTAWHLHHITERYGLFTLIVLGESILASSDAVVEVGQSTRHLPELVLLGASSLVIIVCFWWIYFAFPQHSLLTNIRTALGWGYGHYVVFASAAALSAGIEIALNEEAGDVHLSPAGAAATLAVPCAVYLFFVWFLVLRRQSSRLVNTVVPALAVSLALASFAPHSLQVVAALMVAAVVVVVSGRGRRSAT
ncbi:low temperature requirement protein A [Frondihabitans sp. PAMC 28766]|uniref:low temperature requirement protein A n=1 Tax=Frondihabitans sp. PAMC 28766 TaxID=1795630 RepID=UPI00078CB012|nr:low temperature requirement protein A [Frondihabitans sp. PAMC 28766]AMM20400.1 low temperature requirement protein A [Frondihabitans sp. PAMC 28766]